MNSKGIILIFLGLYSLAGAGFNWNWFMEHRTARFFTKILGGRERARVFYIMLGVGSIIFGVLVMFGVID